MDMNDPGKKFFVVRDPVHGDIYLSKEEGRILDTAAMQRLRSIRQLGTAYLVYPGANHSRFEHSIGTVHMAQRMIDAINRNWKIDPAGCLGVSEEETRVIRLASLLHDMTHIPFGHSIEDQTGLFARHDTPARFLKALSADSEIGGVLEDLGVRKQVLGILLPAGHPERGNIPAYWSQIMNDTICADIFDYLKRDAYFTGLNLFYDERLVNYFKVDRATQNLFIDFSKHNLLREDILSESVRMLEARYFFSERVYYHHAKIAAGALIAKAAEHAVSSGALEEKDFYFQTDDSLIRLLEGAAIPEDETRQRLQRLLNCYRRRQLPKRVCVYPYSKNREIQPRIMEEFFLPGRIEARAAKEKRLALRVKEKTGKDVEIILYCPAQKMQMKEAQIHVRWPGEPRIQPLRNFSSQVPRLKDLEESTRSLWKFYLFATTEDRATRQALQKIAEDEFPGARNLYQID